MSRTVFVGGVPLGSGRVAVQSMTTFQASDVENSVAQILRLQEEGCDIVRVAVKDEEDACAISRIKERISLPLVADVHFSSRLAVLAVEHGADKLRINPGNIGGESALKEVAACVKRHGVPIRVGSNTGSIEPEFYAKYGRSAQALVESALSRVVALEREGVEDIVISVKASDVPLTVEAYELLSGRTEYPLHVGVTEAGGGEFARIKSAVGIGSLLLKGIGDTIRVSLSEDPVQEVRAAHAILRACGLEHDFVEVVSCPTCGRCEYDCLGMAARVEEFVRPYRKKLRVAVMGCVVNGPGEAQDCDLGIAGGKGYCMIFQGEVREKVPAEDAERIFFQRLSELLA